MGDPGLSPRGVIKRVLALLPESGEPTGATLLIYHRIAGGTVNELDLSPQSFRRQLDLLAGHDVVSLDAALDRLDAQDSRPSFVLTFDDGFDEVYDNAWPLLRERRLPFTIYVASSYMGAELTWEGSTATGPAGRGLTWPQLDEMIASGLCTVGNHTHRHVRPEALTEQELDTCTEVVRQRLGVAPQHFTYPWGIAVPAMEDALRSRFRSASTGELGRNLPSADRLRLRRLPVRRSDPDAFFAAKLRGDVRAERAYAALVSGAKRARGVVQRRGATSA